ncbi:MAG: hypothetical protein JST43_12760 [Bacteroidetes bacterium]|nr:hypothetical protein [Bacteroidota bacterium]MBS1541752.1 hypothetical protein [Bacteroidota bacterium]
MDELKVRLSSKRLNSGRFQVGFSTEGISAGYYGYLLTESQTPVAEVLRKIERHIHAMADSERYFQRNLFSFGHRKMKTGRILIFKK